MRGQGQVKGRNTAFPYCGSSGRFDRPQRAQTHPKYWSMSKEATARVQSSYSGSSRSRSDQKRSLRSKAQTSCASRMFVHFVGFLGHFVQSFMGNFVQRFRWWWSFEPLTSSSLTSDWRQTKRCKILTLIFCIKINVSDQEFPRDSKYVIKFCLLSLEFPKIADWKITSHVFRSIVL